MNKLLFVDDEPNVISGLKRQLKKLLPDCKIVGANSGQEALRFIEKTAFDTIVLDIRMPGMDGIELLSLLKTDPKTKFIPVIMLTGCAEKELKRKALDLGAYDFANKPADPYELVARLRGSLRMKSYEDQLRDQNIMLEQQLFQSQKMELIGHLASSVAHDLNNILMIISGNTELAVSKTKGNTNVAANLNAALESCVHGSRLVQQILRLGKGSDSEFEFPHDLKDIVDESLMLLSVIIPKDIKVIWPKPDSACTVNVNQTQMIQVLLNLITNAVHAMNGSGVLTISLTEVSTVDDSHIQSENLSPGPYFKLSVADTGSGMDRSTMDHIFDPFFTTKEKGKGTGIGLSVVNRIVKKFHGFVTVESSVGVGTTLHIHLPVVQTAVRLDKQGEREESVEREKTNSVC